MGVQFDLFQRGRPCFIQENARMQMIQEEKTGVLWPARTQKRTHISHTVEESIHGESCGTHSEVHAAVDRHVAGKVAFESTVRSWHLTVLGLGPVLGALPLCSPRAANASQHSVHETYTAAASQNNVLDRSGVWTACTSSTSAPTRRLDCAREDCAPTGDLKLLFRTPFCSRGCWRFSHSFVDSRLHRVSHRAVLSNDKVRLRLAPAQVASTATARSRAMHY